MKATEIRAGDQLLNDKGEVLYTVLDDPRIYPAPTDAPAEHRRRQYVDAKVRYEIDDGIDVRGWLGDTDTPLVRPEDLR